MNGVLGNNSALLGYNGSGITLTNEMNFGVSHATDADHLLDQLIISSAQGVFWPGISLQCRIVAQNTTIHFIHPFILGSQISSQFCHEVFPSSRPSLAVTESTTLSKQISASNMGKGLQVFKSPAIFIVWYGIEL